CSGHICDSRSLRRPREATHATRFIGEPPRLPAGHLQNEDLWPALTRRDECEPLAVRRPARTRIIAGRSDERAWLAFSFDQPEIALVAILRHLDAGELIRDPLAVGRNLNILDELKGV